MYLKASHYLFNVYSTSLSELRTALLDTRHPEFPTVSSIFLSLSLFLKTLNCYRTTGLLPLWRFASSISLRVITSLSGLIVFFQCPRIVKGQDEGFSIVRDARFTFIASILCCNVRRLIRT